MVHWRTFSLELEHCLQPRGELAEIAWPPILHSEHSPVHSGWWCSEGLECAVAPPLGHLGELLCLFRQQEGRRNGVCTIY